MSNQWTKKDICSHKGLLDGTIENHECDPQMDCTECGGNGRCVECHGSGEVRCKKCNGNGRCTDCHGEGSHRCNECGGSGQCHRCHGSGRITCTKCSGSGKVWVGNDLQTCSKCNGRGSFSCPDCTSGGTKVAKGMTKMLTLGVVDLGGTGHGSGRCSKCGGSGRLTCKTCNGSGNCTRCGGSGQVTCKHCDGSGNCPTCDGTGRITCSRCKGSGWYQTFKTYYAKCYVMQWNYTSSEVLADGLKLATGKQLYEGMYKKWKAINATSLDETNAVKKATCDGFGTNKQYDTFEQNYSKALDKAGNGSDKAYSKSVKISKIKASKVDFRLNNQDYSLYLMGDNGVVMYDDLPKTLVMYKPSFFQGLKLKLTRKKRHISFIKTAAYIFQCDGKTIDESHVLTVFLNGLDMKDEKKATLKEKLVNYNSSMPYESFRKEVKSIFTSKKALTFAWQCMAVDKQVSEQEKEVFAKMVAEYKDIDDTEVENIKRFAAKYSLLKDEYLVQEYLG